MTTANLSGARVFRKQGGTSSTRWYALPDGRTFRWRAYGYPRPSRIDPKILTDRAEFEQVQSIVATWVDRDVDCWDELPTGHLVRRGSDGQPDDRASVEADWGPLVRWEESWLSEQHRAVTLLNAAADRLEQLAAGASPGRWTAVDLAEYGPHMVWWVQCEHTDDTGTLTSTLAELENINRAADAAWIAAMGPAIAPFLAGLLRSAAGIVEEQVLLRDSTQCADINALKVAQHIMEATR